MGERERRLTDTLRNDWLPCIVPYTQKCKGGGKQFAEGDMNKIKELGDIQIKSE